MKHWLLSALAFTLVACGSAEEPDREALPVFTDPDHPVAVSVIAAGPLRADGLFTVTDLSAEQAAERVFKPRSEVPAWTMPVPVDWEADPFSNKNWRYQLHALRPLDPLLLAYDRTGDERLLDAAFALALDWIETHRGTAGEWKAHNGHPGESMAWYDMSAGLRALRLAYLEDRLNEGALSATAEQQRALAESLGDHVAVLSDPDAFSGGNHGLFVAHGLMAACRTLPDLEACGAGRAYARDRIIELIGSQYLPDGGHAEHSPGYHRFVLRSLRTIVDSNWYALPEKSLDTLSNAEAVHGWLADANGLYPNVGDTERERNRKADDVLPPRPGCEGVEDPRSDCFGFHFLPKTGYAVLRTVPNVAESARSSIFVTCARHSDKHKQEDDLSFEWLESSRYLLVDGGKYAYGDSSIRSYVLSRAAHNTVVPAEPERERQDERGGCLSEASFHEGVLSVSGEAPFGRHGRHARSIRYELGESLLITDSVAFEKPFEVRWHLGPGLGAVPNARGYDVMADGRALTTLETDSTCRWHTRSGSSDDAPTAGWTSERYGALTAIVTIIGTCPADTSKVVSRFDLTGR